MSTHVNLTEVSPTGMLVLSLHKVSLKGLIGGTVPYNLCTSEL